MIRHGSCWQRALLAATLLATAGSVRGLDHPQCLREDRCGTRSSVLESAYALVPDHPLPSGMDAARRLPNLAPTGTLQPVPATACFSLTSGGSAQPTTVPIALLAQARAGRLAAPSRAPPFA